MKKPPMSDEAKAMLAKTNAKIRRLSNRATYHSNVYPDASLELIRAMTEQVEEMRKLGYEHVVVDEEMEKTAWVKDPS